MTDAALTPFYKAATGYIRQGWSCFPLQPKAKEPIKGIPIKPYQRDKLPTEPKIAAWAARWPDANIALATGKISGFFVVDCDSEAAFAGLKERGELPDTLTAKTARGYHLYFEYPAFPVGNRAGLLPGVDVRGDGGYVVAPPSLHPTGVKYQFVGGNGKNRAKIAPGPGWLLDMLRPAAAPPQPSNGALMTTFERMAQDPIVVRDPDAYRDKAMRDEMDALRTAREHHRNTQLNTSAFNLGQLVGAGLLSRSEIEGYLSDIAHVIGLKDSEIGPSLASGLDAGIAQPRPLVIEKPTPPPAPNGNGHKPAEAKAAPDKAAKPEGEDRDNLTELGNAKRLVKRWGSRIRYFATKGKWLVWDGTRWETDETGGVMRAAKDVVMNMYHRAAQIEDLERRKDYLKWAMASETRNRLEAMVSLARTEKKVIVRAENLDQNGWLLNCLNYTIDLKTGTAREHSPADMLTRRIGVAYDPKAKAPRWQKFLERIMRGDAEMVEFIQRAIGYTLSGDVSEQCLFFMFGHGRNGKSTFVETLLKLMDEYAIKTPTETLMMRDNKAATNDLARLYGMRAVVAKETDEGQRLAEAVIKDLTGGDKIAARFLYQEFFEFRPTHKLWMYGNHKPIVRGSDFGIWRRIKLIPFAVTIPEAERDPALPWRLEEELPGILNWAIEGCLKWQKHGLGTPKVIQAATEEYREEMDVLGEFLQECCVTAPDGRLTAALLYQEYNSWCSQMGERAISKRALGLRLKERGFTQYRQGPARMWEGLKLRSKDEVIPL